MPQPSEILGGTNPSGQSPEVARGAVEAEAAAGKPAEQTRVSTGIDQAKNTGPCFFNNCLFPFEENYHYLADPHTRVPKDFADPVKYIPLDQADDVYLSLYGSFRPGYFHNLNNVLPTPVGSMDEDENRLTLSGDLHLGKHVRLYGDLYNGNYIGPSSTPPAVVRNDLTSENAFIEIGSDLDNNPNDQVRYGARFGRQFLWLGNGLEVSPSELSVIPTTFDGVRGYMQTPSFRADAFLLESDVAVDGVEAGHPTSGNQLWGLYTSYDVPQSFSGSLKATVEPFYIGARDTHQTYNDVSLELPSAGGPAAFLTGDDIRHSFGIRFVGAARQFDTDITAVYQTGSFANHSVSAWSVSSDSGYTWKHAFLTPRLSLQVNAASGGTSGNTVNTYQPLYWDALYYSDNLNFAPVNFVDFGPHLVLKPLPGLLVDLNNMTVYRQSTSDAVYQGLFAANLPLNLYAPTANMPGSYVGNQLNLTVLGSFGKHMSVLFRTGWFDPGNALRSIGGRSIGSVLLLPSFKF